MLEAPEQRPESYSLPASRGWILLSKGILTMTIKHASNHANGLLPIVITASAVTAIVQIWLAAVSRQVTEPYLVGPSTSIAHRTLFTYA